MTTPESTQREAVQALTKLTHETMDLMNLLTDGKTRDGYLVTGQIAVAALELALQTAQVVLAREDIIAAEEPRP